MRFAPAHTAGPHEALLIEGPAAEAATGRATMYFQSLPVRHVFGCACCTGRGSAASALGALFQARTLGRVPWFTGVVAVVRDPRAIAAEIQADLLAGARFRVEP